MKSEMYYLYHFDECDQLCNAIASYIHFYNCERYQKRLGCMTPMEFLANAPTFEPRRFCGGTLQLALVIKNTAMNFSRVGLLTRFCGFCDDRRYSLRQGLNFLFI